VLVEHAPLEGDNGQASGGDSGVAGERRESRAGKNAVYKPDRCCGVYQTAGASSSPKPAVLIYRYAKSSIAKAADATWTDLSLNMRFPV